jgi:hypothetical protein
MPRSSSIHRSSSNRRSSLLHGNHNNGMSRNEDWTATLRSILDEVMQIAHDVMTDTT